MLQLSRAKPGNPASSSIDNTLNVLKVKILVVCIKNTFWAQTTIQIGDICKLG